MGKVGGIQIAKGHPDPQQRRTEQQKHQAFAANCAGSEFPLPSPS